MARRLVEREDRCVMANGRKLVSVILYIYCNTKSETVVAFDITKTTVFACVSIRVRLSSRLSSPASSSSPATGAGDPGTVEYNGL